MCLAKCNVHRYSTVFDSSYKRGKPITFAPRQVIKGWTEAMKLMREGDKWELYLPAELGYGGRGGADSMTRRQHPRTDTVYSRGAPCTRGPADNTHGLLTVFSSGA
jgi:FKBP-type peptidyl-prolyl cis-trans isomerase 2